MVQQILRIGQRALLLSLIAILSTTTFQTTTSSAQESRFEQAAWGNRGRTAINQLGRRLPAIAARYSMSPDALARELQRDPNLWIDREDKLVYLDEFTPQQFEIIKTPEALLSYAETFKLHSLPGATKVIYLDFDGHTTKGTPWNSSFAGGNDIVSAPYEADNPATTGTFSNAELDKIQYIWQRVAEDYLPFGVDVTTEDPGEEALRNLGGADQNWGIRVVISPTNWYNTGAGGVAYLGSFVWNSDTPCWAFTAQLGNGHEKYVAEAVSHEVGHSLGLQHDGQTNGTAYYQGHGAEPLGWAPIMGVGYYRSITQWSKGEYALANQLQDDLAVMTGNYGITYRNDDHGNSTAAATALTVTNNVTVSGKGIIERSTDKDYFSFTTGSGQISLSVTGGPRSPNLDIKAELINANGTVVASSDAAGLNAAFTTTVSAGTYYLAIDGVGAGDASTGYTDYASLGEFNISGTIIATAGGQAPVAVAAANIVSGPAPLTVNFTSVGSSDPDGTIASYAWNFGNGSNSTQANASAVYTAAGTYKAVLTVTDDDGFSDTAEVTITVVAPPLAPTSLTAASASSSQINLAWTDNSNNETGFQIERSMDNATWASLASVGANVRTYSNTGLTANTRYYYRVLAVNTIGNSGYSNTANATTTVAASYIDFVATGETPVVGTLTGNYTATTSNNGTAETITEVVSGGAVSSRYSYLQHKWMLNVTAGYGTTLYANAWQSASTDGDNFLFAYSTDNKTFIPMFTVTATSDSGYQQYALPANLSGTVYICVTDTNRSRGKTALDKIMVDHLYIRVDTVAPPPPSAPTNLTASAASASQINLSWTDTSNNESGFQVERSLDGNTWAALGTTPANVTAGASVGLTSNTTYYYRVRAFNLGGNSAYSNVANAKTPVVPAIHVGNIDATATRQSTGRWTANVTITTHTAADAALSRVIVTGTWSNGASGSGQCTTDANGRCTITLTSIPSGSTSATFTVGSLTLAGYAYSATGNHDADRTSNGSVIVIKKP